MTMRYREGPGNLVTLLRCDTPVHKASAPPETIEALQAKSILNIKAAMSNLVEALEIVRRLIEVGKASNTVAGNSAASADWAMTVSTDTKIASA